MNLRSNFNKKKLSYSAGFVLLLLFLSCLVPPLKSPALGILKYPISLANLIRREIGGIIFYHRNLIQNEKSGKEIDLLKQKINLLNEAYLENKRLHNLLSFKRKSPDKMVASRVIGLSADNWSSVIIVDKGTYEGVRAGCVAVTYLGLAGRVVEASAHTSKVMLIKDTNFSVSSMVQRSRQEGLVSGTLGGFLIMRYLPQDADIKASDAIITSGLTEAYPKGLLIGRVVDIGKEFSGLSRYAIIKPAVNLSSLEEVLIIIP